MFVLASPNWWCVSLQYLQAAQGDREEHVAVLAKHGADSESVESPRSTVLHSPVKKGSVTSQPCSVDTEAKAAVRSLNPIPNTHMASWSTYRSSNVYCFEMGQSSKVLLKYWDCVVLSVCFCVWPEVDISANLNHSPPNYYYCVYVCTHAYDVCKDVHVIIHVCRSEDRFFESVLSFSLYMGS